MPTERLQKIIAAAGIASRRKAEELITSGRVAVNGQVVTELGTKADPEHDHIRVNGKLLQGAQQHVYILLNKPKGFVTTVSDPERRPTVMSLLRGVKARVYPVGRLDYASEGLLLLTNDGDLALKLMKAASHVPKTYMVKVSGKPTPEDLAKLRAGISIPADQRGRRIRTAPAKINVIKDATNPWYEVTLIEGRNRQIRRMFEQVGHHVEKIKRVRYGSLQLDVPPGKYRLLQPQEVDRLRTAVGTRSSKTDFPARRREC
jgi:23S rRNA pseudouridine2605 synthase